jgi:hypothetical protein
MKEPADINNYWHDSKNNDLHALIIQPENSFLPEASAFLMQALTLAP